MDNKITTIELSIEECELIRKALVAYDSSAKQLLRYGDWLKLRLKLDSILERIDAWRNSCEDIEELLEEIDDSLEDLDLKY